MTGFVQPSPSDDCAVCGRYIKEDGTCHVSLNPTIVLYHASCCPCRKGQE